MHRHLLVVGGGDLREFADGMGFIDANGQVMFDTPGQFGFLPFAQQQQRRGDAGVAERHGLFERAEAKAPRAFFERDARHVERAVAVGLVLDDGEQSYVFRQVAADKPQIGSQPAEVNLGPGRPQRKIGRIEIHKTSRLFNHESCQMARKIRHGWRDFTPVKSANQNP